ncbi:MAG: argonaute/piwi family protein [Ktedonobacteraceae bacterium]
MKLDFLQEPELEFGTGRHIDIRFGLMNYGPLDYEQSLAPKLIKVGIVGTSETVEGIQTWLERCRSEIPAKLSRQPNLFPKFPGFNVDTSFRSSLLMDQQLLREIPLWLFEALKTQLDSNGIVTEAVELFFSELNYLAEKAKGDVFVCALPMELIDLLEQRNQMNKGLVEDDNEELEGQLHLDLHHMLKARAMQLKKPIQIVLPMTYDETKRRQQKGHSDRVRKLQDEATRAWNIHTALYYKAGGVPWRIIRDSSQLTTCYIGISFYKTLDNSRLLTSIAQVFNERGEGVIVRGGAAKISKDDKQPHLQKEDAFLLLNQAMERYRQEHRNLPARVALYKSSIYSSEEIEGFTQAAQNQRVDSIDLISMTNSYIRLFRKGVYPPLRGTFFSLDDRSHVLYTRGSTDFFSTYPGMYVPSPLLFRRELTEQTPKFLAQEILALTKMNWNNTQFDGGEPITLRAAYQVGAILKYIGEHETVMPRYSFYM